ncbi:bacterio-opsin activator domain-containing protein [Natronobiforma cellulositropha]|uniref:bacterio-opsin activator domain-containing protein n=1 Tax=Natronobiforma cellulositropha TaxID=1679076 RepID=UPI0021D613DD|nr:bacterio-opsin activator domain-containing protein [Natronobiforma cellulositropha]
MSLYGEFQVPAEVFALYETLQQVPETTVEIERVVATDEVLTPYFWVAGEDQRAFETAARDDPSISDCRRLDDFEQATLYRASWTENIETIVYAYAEVGATILEASGQSDWWELKMRFDDRERFDAFRTYCADNDIPFRLTQFHELARPQTGSQYGLTPKQHDALVTAWKREYFTSPSVSLTDVASELGISQQSLSQRLQRGFHSLIAHTLVVTSPETDDRRP